jgi:hypothetical protein
MTDPLRGPKKGSSGGRSRFTWRSLFESLHPRREGTMPAGLILVVIVLAFVVAGILNADATLRKSNAKGESWRNDIAQTVASVTDTFRLNFLRNSIDDALGKNQGTQIDVEELLRQQAEAESAAAAAAAAKVPELPAPSPAEPMKIWVGGDSITQTFGTSFQRIAQSTGIFTPTLDFHVSTGLARPDYFNWPEHLVKNVLPADPKILVIMFGANDGQNMVDASGKALERFSEPWMLEYRRRVAATMDLLKSPDNQRITIWCGPPPMGPGSKTRGMDQLNYIYWSEAQSRPWIQYFDTWPFFTDANYNFAANLPNADGVVRGMRQKDNVHLSTVGGDRLSWAVIDRIGKLVDLSAGKVTPPASQAPPPDVVERTEVPPTMPGAE